MRNFEAASRIARIQSLLKDLDARLVRSIVEAYPEVNGLSGSKLAEFVKDQIHLLSEITDRQIFRKEMLQACEVLKSNPGNKAAQGIRASFFAKAFREYQRERSNLALELEKLQS